LKYKNIIFDFDGVLAESLHIKTQAFYQMYERYGADVARKVITHHKIYGGMSRYEKFPYYHKSFLNIELSAEEVNQLSVDFSKIVIERILNAEEVKGALWFLKKYQKQCEFWIVSATPMKEIIEIATKRGIADFFVKIYGSPGKKPEIVKNIIYNNKLILKDSVFLGDTMSDFEAAKNNNIDFLLRSTDENENLFKTYKGIERFNDFYELDKIFNNE